MFLFIFYLKVCTWYLFLLFLLFPITTSWIINDNDIHLLDKWNVTVTSTNPSIRQYSLSRIYDFQFFVNTFSIDPIIINGVYISKLKQFDHYFISFSKGEWNEDWFPSNSFYPSGLFIQFPSDYKKDDLQQLVADLHDSFSSNSYFHSKFLYFNFYYESFYLCTSFFHALQMTFFPTLLNLSNFISLPFFSLEFTILNGQVHSHIRFIDWNGLSPISPPIHQLCWNKDYVNAVLIISSKLNVSSIHIMKDPHLLYCTSQITLSTHSIFLSENSQAIHLSISIPQPIQIELPLQKLPINLDFLPYNSNLGISLPPVEIHLQERVIYTDYTLATVLTPDTTMRYDCVTIGIVTLLLFSILLFKKIVEL